MRDLVAKHPAPTMGKEDHGENLTRSGTGGADDSNASLSRRAHWPDWVLDLRLLELYRLRLQVGQDLVRLRGAELAERRPAQAIDEGLRRGFECHGTPPRLWGRLTWSTAFENLDRMKWLTPLDVVAYAAPQSEPRSTPQAEGGQPWTILASTCTRRKTRSASWARRARSSSGASAPRPSGSPRSWATARGSASSSRP